MFVFLYVTFKDEKSAKSLAKKLIADRLVACANIFPKMHSVYQWKGKLEESAEAVAFFKTEKVKVDRVRSFILENHSYDVPCIAEIGLDSLNHEYSQWLKSQLV